jgi:hypothetical protein
MKARRAVELRRVRAAAVPLPMAAARTRARSTGRARRGGQNGRDDVAVNRDFMLERRLNDPRSVTAAREVRGQMLRRVRLQSHYICSL